MVTMSQRNGYPTLCTGCSLSFQIKSQPSILKANCDGFFTLGKDFKRVRFANGGPIQGQALGPHSQNGHVVGPYQGILLGFPSWHSPFVSFPSVCYEGKEQTENNNNTYAWQVATFTSSQESQVKQHDFDGPF